jgi:hypothetical protein
MVDALDGQVIDLDYEQDPFRMPTAQRYPWPKERFRYEHKEPEQSTTTREQPKVEQLDNGLLLVTRYIYLDRGMGMVAGIDKKLALRSHFSRDTLG